MIRDSWTFQYPAEKVAAAAHERAVYHQSRVEHWTVTRDAVVGDLRDSGLEITEQQVTGGERFDVQFDPAKTKRLSEAQSKIRDHARKQQRYEAFARVLLRQPTQVLELDVDDVDYFGLADPPAQTVDLGQAS